MAVNGPSQSLDLFTPMFFPEDPGVMLGLSIEQNINPTGYVAPTAWSYNTFPNQAPVLWERAWYKARTSRLAPAVHSVIAFVPVRVTGVAAAPTIIKPVRIVDAGTATGVLKVVAQAAGAPGKVASSTGLVRLLPKSTLLGLVQPSPPASGPILVTGYVDGFTATSLPVTGVTIQLTGNAGTPSTLAGGTATGTIRLTGTGTGLRAVPGSPKAAPIKITGTAKAIGVPPMTATPGVIKVTGIADATVTRYSTTTGTVRLLGTAKGVNGAPLAASGPIIVTAREATVLDSLPGTIRLTGTAEAMAIRYAKSTGSKVRVLPVSASARQSGEPYAIGIVRVVGRITETHEVAANPGFIEVNPGKVAAVRAPTLNTSGQIYLYALKAAAQRVVSIVATGSKVVLSAIAGDPAVYPSFSGAGGIEVTGAAQADTEEGHKASGGIVVNAEIGTNEPIVIATGTGIATIDLHSIGTGDIVPVPRHEAVGDATIHLDADGEGYLPVLMRSNAWVILRGVGQGAKTIESGNGILARIDIGAYGTALPLRFIREKVAPHRADKLLMDWRLTKRIVRHAALDPILAWRVDKPETSNRLDSEIELTTTQGVR